VRCDVLQQQLNDLRPNSFADAWSDRLAEPQSQLLAQRFPNPRAQQVANNEPDH